MNTKLNMAPVPARAPLGPVVPVRREVVERKPVQHMDTSWQERGSCRKVNPEWFYPGRGQNDYVRAAKSVCAGCPVIDTCLDFAMKTEPINDWGVWGGTTEGERTRLRRMNRRAA